MALSFMLDLGINLLYKAGSVLGGEEEMYNYEIEKPYVLTDEGQRKFLKVRDVADAAFKIAGAVRADKLMGAAGCGDSWKNMACVDRLVELGEIREVGTEGTHAWQCRVFVSARGD